jgi:hypothetical protein
MSNETVKIDAVKSVSRAAVLAIKKTKLILI